MRRGWPLLLLVAVAAVGASLYATSQRKPEYEATARLLVTPLSQNDMALFGIDLVRDTGEPSATVSSAAILVKSSEAAEATAERLGRGLSANAVSDAVTVTAISDTSIVEVTGRNEDAKLAAAMATEFARSAIRLRRAKIVPQLERRLRSLNAQRRQAPVNDYSQRDRLITTTRLIRDTLDSGGDPTLSFAQAADVPVASATRSRAVDAALALAGGLALGLIAIIALDRLRGPARGRQRSSYASSSATAVSGAAKKKSLT